MAGHPLAWIGIGVLALAALYLMLSGGGAALGPLQGGDVARLAAAVALLIVIGGGILFSRGFSAGTALRHAVIWLLIAAGLVLAYSYRAEFTAIGNRVMTELVPGMPVAAVDQQGQVTVSLRRVGSGHFAARGSVNGAATTFLIDTGASRLTLTETTAQAAGLEPSGLRFATPVQTANGIALVAPVLLDRIEIGPLSFDDVQAFVAPAAALTTDLLGVNVLNRLQSYEVRGDEMVLRGGG